MGIASRNLEFWLCGTRQGPAIVRRRGSTRSHYITTCNSRAVVCGERWSPHPRAPYGRSPAVAVASRRFFLSSFFFLSLSFFGSAIAEPSNLWKRDFAARTQQFDPAPSAQGDLGDSAATLTLKSRPSSTTRPEEGPHGINQIKGNTTLGTGRRSSSGPRRARWRTAGTHDVWRVASWLSRHPPQYAYDGSSYQTTQAEGALPEATSSGATGGGDGYPTSTNPYGYVETTMTTEYYQPMFEEAATTTQSTTVADFTHQSAVDQHAYAGSPYMLPSASTRGFQGSQQEWEAAYQPAENYYDPDTGKASQFMATQVEQPEMPPEIQYPDFHAEEQVSASIRGKRLIFRDGPMAGKVFRWVREKALVVVQYLVSHLEPQSPLQVRARAGSSPTQGRSFMELRDRRAIQPPAILAMRCWQCHARLQDMVTTVDDISPWLEDDQVWDETDIGARYEPTRVASRVAPSIDRFVWQLLPSFRFTSDLDPSRFVCSATLLQASSGSTPSVSGSSPASDAGPSSAVTTVSRQSILSPSGSSVFLPANSLLDHSSGSISGTSRRGSGSEKSSKRRKVSRSPQLFPLQQQGFDNGSLEGRGFSGSLAIDIPSTTQASAFPWSPSSALGSSTARIRNLYGRVHVNGRKVVVPESSGGDGLLRVWFIFPVRSYVPRGMRAVWGRH